MPCWSHLAKADYFCICERGLHKKLLKMTVSWKINVHRRVHPFTYTGSFHPTGCKRCNAFKYITFADLLHSIKTFVLLVGILAASCILRANCACWPACWPACPLASRPLLRRGFSLTQLLASCLWCCLRVQLILHFLKIQEDGTQNTNGSRCINPHRCINPCWSAVTMISLECRIDAPFHNVRLPRMSPFSSWMNL